MAIRHPNVVRVHSVREPEGTAPYVVMEALFGESLGQFLRREFSMPIGLGTHVARQAATGLSGLHRAGLVHRDIKPDNIFLVGPPGAPEDAKILDFGLAKIGTSGAGAEQPDELAANENGDFVMGTAQYMAPEQILGDAVDARTDLYAFGVVMFRMFTGYLPFDLDLNVELLRHQVASPAPPASWLNDRLGGNLDAVILKALRKNPANRYETARDLLRDIDSVRTGRPTRAECERLAVQPDVYVPQTEYARRASLILERARC
jgi:serine/threonine-protein kinase